jgi:FkbM family methyltransferase
MIWPLKPYYSRIFQGATPIPEPEESGPILYPKYVKEDDIVVEVGANVGGGTILLSKLAKKVYAFEPFKINYTMLKVNTRKWANVVVFNIGLGSERALLPLNIADKNAPSYSASVKKIGGLSYGDSETIRLETLDDLMFESRPTALVIDCEGYECEVLRGAQKTIPKLKTILIETHTLSDGTETIGPVQRELSNYSDIFDSHETFTDPEGLKWVVVSHKAK